MKVALVVGHSRESVGACSKRFNICEHQYNTEFVSDLSKILDVKYVVIHRQSLMTLPNTINKEKPDFIISFHCNAFDTHASGCEMLYYHKSGIGKKCAAILQRKVLLALSNKNRDIKAKTSEDRGGFLLRYTEAPCIIAEPFFIDNDMDFANAQVCRDALLFAVKEAIEEIANYIEKEKQCKR